MNNAATNRSAKTMMNADPPPIRMTNATDTTQNKIPNSTISVTISSLLSSRLYSITAIENIAKYVAADYMTPSLATFSMATKSPRAFACHALFWKVLDIRLAKVVCLVAHSFFDKVAHARAE